MKDYNVIDGQLNIFKNNQDLIQCGLQKFKNWWILKKINIRLKWLCYKKIKNIYFKLDRMSYMKK